jgi:hypothetical protein
VKHWGTRVAFGWVLWIAGCAPGAPETELLPEVPAEGADAGNSALDAATAARPAPVPSSARTAGLRARLCPPGQGDCDGRADNGCETDLLGDSANCGACNAPCLDRPNAFGRCVRGFCEQSCLPTYASCDGNPLDGCEAFLLLDPRNCGACGNVCPPEFVCAGGACAPRAQPTNP